MARIEDGDTASQLLAVEPGIKAARVCLTPRGYGYGIAATTGTIAAALAANSTLLSMRLDPGTTRRAFIERVRIEFTTIVAFTTPVVAGRRLSLYRMQTTAVASGGTAITAALSKHGSGDTSDFSAANGGDIRISSTGTLTVTGTVDANPFRELSLAHVGAAGGYREALWEFASGAESQPIQLDPGQALVIRNPVAMDAAGTWQLSVAVDWHEAPALDYAG